MAVHVILLLQTTDDPDTRTYTDYESLEECFKGIRNIYESYLDERDPDAPEITYTTEELREFIKELKDVSLLIFQFATNTYAPFDKDFLTEKLDNFLINEFLTSSRLQSTSPPTEAKPETSSEHEPKLKTSGEHKPKLKSVVYKLPTSHSNAELPVQSNSKSNTQSTAKSDAQSTSTADSKSVSKSESNSIPKSESTTSKSESTTSKSDSKSHHHHHRHRREKYKIYRRD